jgi:flagellar hook-length control protein FliK
MRVPVAASSGIGLADTFAERLDQATAASKPAHETSTDAPPAEAVPAEAPANPGEAEPTPDPVAATPDLDQRSPTAAEPPARAVMQALPQTNRGGEPELRIEAGKDSGSPRTSARPVAPGLPAVASARTANAPGFVPGAAVAAANGAGPAVPAANVRAEVSALGKTAPLRAGALQTGYRTLNPQAVQLVEQARDSVFKQILFKLDEGNSEMRLRLEPPELGELDLRLVVENGNQLRLSIGAERADLAQMLAKDPDQLRHALQQHGLQITHAEVHTGTGSSAGGNADGEERGGSASADQRDAAPAATQRPHGFLSAQSLDCWV